MKKYRDYTDLIFENWRLPGDWYTLEQRFTADRQQTSYVMDTFLHPDEHIYGHRNCRGEDQPLGHKIFITIVERSQKDKFSRSKRWTVTTGRHTYLDMSTNHFDYLEDAVKFATNQMILTTKKFDSIHNRKTPIWDLKLIENYDTNTDTIE